jgi:capsular exopolysaccharide synthesis family protein
VSNIFDALRRNGNQSAGIDLPDLLEEDGELLRHRERARVEASGAAPLPEPPPEPHNGYAGSAFRTGNIRTRPMSIRIAGPVLPFDRDHQNIDQYRMLRTKIQQHPSQPRVLLIAGSGPGDGKTTTAINLSGALSLKPHTSVVVVDADFRRSSIRKTLGLERGPGLVEVLDGSAALEDGLIRTEQYPGLYVLGSVEGAPGSAELLDSPRWTAILDALRKEFTYVVLDSPPIGSLADYDLLQACADGIILVVRPDHSRREPTVKALNSIPPEKFLGVVVNCVEKWFLRKDYYYNHAYYATAPHDRE